MLLSKTGGLESLEVQGTMSLVVGSDADAYVAVQVRLEVDFVVQGRRLLWIGRDLVGRRNMLTKLPCPCLPGLPACLSVCVHACMCVV